MRKSIILIFSFIAFSCQTQLDKDKHGFENILETTKVNVINSLVADFENNLKTNYPKLTIDKAYEKYLTEIISDSITDFEKFKFQTPSTQADLNESGLWKEIYKKDDNGGLQINETGQYMRALNYVAKSDEFVKEYYEKRRDAGMMSNQLFVNGILNSNPDYNDYFHKRIIVLEFTF